MRTRFFSAVLAAFMLATASVGVTASAAEIDEPDVAVEEIEADKPVEENADDEDGTAATEGADSAEEIATVGEAVTAAVEENSSFSEEDFNMQDFMKIMSEFAENGGIAESDTPDYYNDPYYDTDGNATLIKSEKIVYNSEEMQFIAVTTKDGHVFYVLINYSAENDEDQVFFLNKVDDYDLYALLYAGAESDDEEENITPEQAFEAAQAANGRVQVDSAAVTETEDSTDETSENEETAAQPKQNNMNSIYLLLGAVALIGVGGAGFYMMKKKNGGKSVVKETVDDEDEDDITFPDDEEY